MLIFNNDPTPFTLEALQTFIHNIGGVNNGKLMVSGAYYNGDSQEIIITSYLTYRPDEYYYLSGIDSSNGNAIYKRGTTLQAIFATTDIEDGVNDIN